MRSSNIEPGLLHIFRWFVAIRLSLLGLVAWSSNRNPDPVNPRFPQVEILFLGAVMFLLLWPRMQRAMGRTFFPSVLILATVGSIAGGAAQIEGRLDAGLSSNAALVDFPLSFFLLFVPLLLIAWQYRYRSVLVFAVGTTVLDLGAVIPLVESERTNVAELSGIIVVRGLLFAFVGLVVVKLANAQKQARRSLTTHSATLEQLATSRERNRLARDLHDTLAHSLSGIAVQLEAVRTLWDGDSEQARSMLDRALADARAGLGEARRAIQALRASPLEDLGLVAALRRLGATMAERHRLRITTTIADSIDSLDPEIENATYRIADEALTNIARHAGADRVSLDLKRKAGRVQLTVADNGCGFEVAAEPPEGHVGIEGMRERAAMVDGTLEITSGSSGTTVVFEVAPWK
jgi:signal transduction histidine kinase